MNQIFRANGLSNLHMMYTGVNLHEGYDTQGGSDQSRYLSNCTSTPALAFYQLTFRQVSGGVGAQLHRY